MAPMDNAATKELLSFHLLLSRAASAASSLTSINAENFSGAFAANHWNKNGNIEMKFA